MIKCPKSARRTAAVCPLYTDFKCCSSEMCTVNVPMRFVGAESTRIIGGNYGEMCVSELCRSNLFCGPVCIDSYTTMGLMY